METISENVAYRYGVQVHAAEVYISAYVLLAVVVGLWAKWRKWSMNDFQTACGVIWCILQQDTLNDMTWMVVLIVVVFLPMLRRVAELEEKLRAR